MVGVGAVATYLIPKKAEALVFGSTPTSNVVGVKNASNVKINPATEDTLGLMRAKTDLLTFDAGANPANLKVAIASIAPGADIGLQNASNVTINPAMEDGNLATLTASAGTIATNTTKLTSLNFDGSGNLLTVAAGGAASSVGLKDSSSNVINPATDDSVTYLRRIVKLMESQAVVDGANRQRVNVDGFGTNVGLVTGTGASGAGVPRVTVSSDSSLVLAAGANAIGSLTAGAAVIGSLTNLSTLAGQNQQMYQDVARNAFANGVRQNLVFS